LLLQGPAHVDIAVCDGNVLPAAPRSRVLWRHKPSGIGEPRTCSSPGTMAATFSFTRSGLKVHPTAAEREAERTTRLLDSRTRTIGVRQQGWFR